MRPRREPQQKVPRTYLHTFDVYLDKSAGVRAAFQSSYETIAAHVLGRRQSGAYLVFILDGETLRQRAAATGARTVDGMLPEARGARLIADEHQFECPERRRHAPVCILLAQRSAPSGVPVRSGTYLGTI